MASERSRGGLQSELENIQNSLLELKRLIEQEKKILNDYRNRTKTQKTKQDGKMEVSFVSPQLQLNFSVKL